MHVGAMSSWELEQAYTTTFPILGAALLVTEAVCTHSSTTWTHASTAECTHACLSFTLIIIQDNHQDHKTLTVQLADMMRYACQVMTDHAGPGLHLALPVPQGGEGGHNQEGPWDVTQLALKLQCADGLCSLA